MVRFGFSTKKKQRKKTKAELWQESAAIEQQRAGKQEYPPAPASLSSSSKSSSSQSSRDKNKKKRKGKHSGSEENNEVSLVRNDSQLSHPGYDPFSAEEYIPASKRRSQFDSSVLAMREEDKRSSGTNSQPRDRARHKEEPPRYLAYENFYPDSNKQDYHGDANNDSLSEAGPYRKSTSMYRPANGSLESSSDEEQKHKPKSRSKSRKKAERDNSRFGAPTTLSDISEDKERYFRQQETKKKRPIGSVGAKITQFCDSVAEEVSDTLSRFFNSAKLFFKTCFWSSGQNRTRG